MDTDSRIREDSLKLALMASARIGLLEGALEECRKFIEKYADVVDSDSGYPKPTRAMQLMNMIDEIMNGGGW